MRGADNKFVAMENAPRGVFIGPLFLLGSHFMQTGKVLGIGAALSAGLLAAHVASAATLTLEEYVVGISSFGTTSLTGSAGSYSAGAGSYRGLSWTGVSSTVANSGGTDSLSLTFTGLTGTAYDGFLISDTSFSEMGTGLTLSASSSSTATTGSGGGVFAPIGFADKNDKLFGVPSGNISGYPSGSVVSESSGAYSADTGSPSTVNISAPYSLTTNALVNTLASGGSSIYTVTATASVTGGTASAVTLPGSGPLSLIGGLVVVGGLAIRRRMKL